MIALDQSITQFLFNLIPHVPILNLFFMFFSAVGSFGIVWIILGILIIVFEEEKHREFIVYFLGGLLVTTILVNYVIKPIVHRGRPHQNIVEQPIDYSFPSGHAATSVFAALLLTHYHRKKKWLFLTLAGFISFSRIYLGVHYAGDVLIGAIIGAIIACAIINSKFKIRNSKLKKRPKLKKKY